MSGKGFIPVQPLTNVGNSSAGDANLYIPSQTQYTNLRSVGIGSLAVRSGATELRASATQTGNTFNGSFDASDFLHILSLDTTGTIDELRHGTMLANVLPVPEPSGILMAGVTMVTIRAWRPPPPPLGAPLRHQFLDLLRLDRDVSHQVGV